MTAIGTPADLADACVEADAIILRHLPDGAERAALLGLVGVIRRGEYTRDRGADFWREHMAEEESRIAREAVVEHARALAAEFDGAPRASAHTRLAMRAVTDGLSADAENAARRWPESRRKASSAVLGLILCVIQNDLADWRAYFNDWMREP